MFPLGLAVGLVAGAAGALLFGSQIAREARPIAKATHGGNAVVTGRQIVPRRIVFVGR